MMPIQLGVLDFVPPAEKLDALVKLINDVYDVAEDGMWKVKGFRTNLDEIRGLIEEGRLIVAHKLGSGDEQRSVVGCVKVERLDKEDCGQFGMLVVCPTCRSSGVGGKLVEAAEDWARDKGFACMQLELLTPRTWKQPSKEFAHSWYTRLGYKSMRTEPFEKDFAHLTDLLATSCDFTVYRKPLSTPDIGT